jgi:Ca-activated chloride channel homolog
MTFLWPNMLWLLAALPALVALYLYALRRKQKSVARYPSLSMVKAALGPGSSIRRHVPALVLLLAIAGMLLAMARPAAVITLPSHHETVILAMDVSGSMRADDVKPNRLAAAQAAARAFVKDTPGSTRIGVVTFAGSAALVQAATTDREQIFAAIDSFQLQHATAVGSGILVSLKAIFPEQDFEMAEPLQAARQKVDKEPVKHIAPGSYSNAAIVLLSDGQTTSGPDPVEAAKLAADRGVRIFTVGVGTPDGQILTGEGWSIRVRLDEDALKQIAAMTRGEYFFAGSAPDLKKVYETLTSRLVLERKHTEITAVFSALAVVMVLLSAGLSLAWFSRAV